MVENFTEHPIDLSPENRQYRFKKKGGNQGTLTWLKVKCCVCGGKVNSWDRRIWTALMYRAPHCEKCIAKEYGETVEDLRNIMEEEFGMQPCAGI